MRYYYFYKSLIMGTPKGNYKGGNGWEGRVFDLYGEKFKAFTTPNMNNMTSGCTVTFGKCRPGVRFESWCGEYKYLDTNNATYWMSKPFRLNWKIAEQFQQGLGAYLGMRCMLNSFGTESSDDLLYSMFLNYSRQMAALGDMIYLFYKNAQNIGNFGKDEIKKKIGGMNYADARTITALYRLTANYPKFVSDFRQNLTDDTKKNHPMKDLFDPIFSIKHTSWQSFLTIQYFKQVFPKNDGLDERFYMSNFFKDELGFQLLYESSPFNSKLEDGVQVNDDISDKDWWDKVLTGGEKTPLCYHPKLCYLGHRMMCEEVREKKEASGKLFGEKKNEFYRKEAVATGKKL